MHANYQARHHGCQAELERRASGRCRLGQSSNDGSVTHEVLDSDEDLVSDDMLAAAGRTPASEG